MKKFREYACHRLVEDLALDVNSLCAMILKALGGNSESKSGYNSPLIQFADPGQLLDRLSASPAIQQLLQNNPSGQQAIQKTQQTQSDELTVFKLANLLLPQGSTP